MCVSIYESVCMHVSVYMCVFVCMKTREQKRIGYLGNKGDQQEEGGRMGRVVEGG